MDTPKSPVADEVESFIQPTSGQCTPKESELAVLSSAPVVAGSLVSRTLICVALDILKATDLVFLVQAMGLGSRYHSVPLSVSFFL